MVEITNIYFNIGEDYDVSALKDEILKAYEENERIRTIFDLNGKEINLSAMGKIKKIFDEIGVEKLEETCVVSNERFKVALIRNFLKLVKTKRPVKFL